MEMKNVSHEDVEDLPMDEVIKKCEEIMSRGGVTFIKFTCANCGVRQTSINPNVLHIAGYHCEECGLLNKPKKYGILAIFYSGPYEELMDILQRFIEKECKQNMDSHKFN